jgi:hypothetical protein
MEVPLEKPTTVEFEGRRVPAVEVSFETEKEPWSVYCLNDGSVVKMKQALVSIWRLTEDFKPDGEPIYVYKLAGVNSVEVPENLKKRE